MEIKITAKGLDNVVIKLGNFTNNMPFLIAKTLTNTAQEVKKENTGIIQRIFDRPTPYTLKSIFIKPATKSSLQAVVDIKDAAQRYLGPQIHGGARQLKRSERYLGDRYYVPGKGARLNKYGNMSQGQITQVLSVLKRLPDQYSWMTERSKKMNLKPRNYFMLRSPKSGLAPGVWEKTGKTGVRLRPVMIFIKSPSYKKRWMFYETGRKVIRDKLEYIFFKQPEEYERVLLRLMCRYSNAYPSEKQLMEKNNNGILEHSGIMELIYGKR